MEHLIVQHYYSDINNNVLSDISYDIFKDYKELVYFVIDKYAHFTKKNSLPFYDSNILMYRCGSVSTLGEFRIYSNPLPIYLEDIKEMLKND